MVFVFEGELIEWRGPAPFVFLPVPPEESAQIKEISNRLSYGWGCIAVAARIGGTEYTTSLFPKDGRYLLPVKVIVQRAEKVGVGDWVQAEMELGG